ncbi:hypothetical protein TWF102_004113 [Orbilia oligospora]|uniref:Uncharacterized protein n=1 Tax=Orbilia oligospora TaxID=2813651 RepID=A0A7C8JVR4_ORBOL|nr:hypothetical protein TWF102_004113 [Orbilia oligospora]KAF3117642.1 hypothetical protein TWF103_004325 [Orbilia oligospora]KAF3142841.1 hypothetical protein TWF703_000345 [Orbilia oligospora]KAF3152066.1 hypothetical protein TWF594_005820 [Orbilia oligospora]
MTPENLDFAAAPYLQTFTVLCLKPPSTKGVVWKPLHLGLLGFGVVTLESVDVESITDHFKRFSRSRNFFDFTVQVLVGSEILGDGVDVANFGGTL